MKRINILVIVFFALGIFCVHAQDVITLRSAEQIRAKVTEITPMEIKYKRFDNLDGPTITVSRADVFAITYENGRRDVINPFTASDTNNRSSAASSRQNASGRQGDFAIGVNALFAVLSYNEFGIGGKLQYNVTNRLRLAGEFDFFPKTHVWSWWDLSLYGHYLLFLGDKAAVYPSVGIGMLNLKYIEDDFNGTLYSGPVFSPGIGFDISLTSNLILNGEVRPKLGGIVQRINFVLGLAYRF